MVDLTEFLLARIAEDEADARSATQGTWAPDRQGWVDAEGRAFIQSPYHELEISREDVRHVTNWQPARVLAECEAKRRIVEEFRESQRAAEALDGDHPTPSYWQEWGTRHGLWSAVEHMAFVYSDHPDYDPEWRP